VEVVAKGVSGVDAGYELLEGGRGEEALVVDVETLERLKGWVSE
jgi:hypothetical protein